ncbi:alpha-amylase [Phormidium tenue FACHB-886]|nr:alpha-amylase [Phormidium tenue FACHB-886]
MSQPPLNGVILQGFHAHLSNDGTHWDLLRSTAPELAAAGFTAIWLPPPCKGSNGIDDTGYAVYDLFDLGEFDQCGTVRTRYGTRSQLLDAIQAIQAVGMQVYGDCVLHHKHGGDEVEELEAVPVAAGDRNFSIGEPEQIKAWTRFTFHGRGGAYSGFKWEGRHFESVNHNVLRPDDNTVYRFKNGCFDIELDPRHAEESFGTACDVDTADLEVIAELKRWGSWFLETTGIDGVRLDAAKHLHADFCKEWLVAVCAHAGQSLFTAANYWAEDITLLHQFIQSTGGNWSLFDVPLHYNFHRASRSGGYYDMRRIFDGTLMQQQPSLAVTFVDNHDSQPLQVLESVVEPWFKPIAYALILLRQEGYPCVFAADYYGTHYWDKDWEVWMPRHRWILDKFLYARKHFTHGKQYDYFDHFNVIGWTCLGDEQHPKAMAVILSDGWGGSKWMEVGKPDTVFYDLTEHSSYPVYTNEHGWGEFYCKGGSVSVWVEE